MPRLVWPSWRWMTISGTPSRAISTAWAWRSRCGAKRRRTPASRATRRSSVRAAAAVDTVAGVAHHGDDLPDRRWVGGVAYFLVARRPARGELPPRGGGRAGGRG